MTQLTASSAPIVDDGGRATVDFRTQLQEVFNAVSALGQSNFGTPTGVGNSGSFNMNWTTPVSPAPTQAEVSSIRDQVIVLSERLGQLILDLKAAGVIR